MAAPRYTEQSFRPATSRRSRPRRSGAVVTRRSGTPWKTVIAMILVAVTCLAGVLYATGCAPFGPSVSFDGLHSRYAVLMDAGTGRTIQSRDADARMYPASLTKVMTAVVVLERTDSLDTVIEAPADIFPALWAANASVAGLQPGETATVEDMLYGMMLASGADCALALARHVAGDESAFADMMNRTATAIGMTGTHFTNATGLHDADHYSTARDMAVLFSYAMRDDTFRTITGARSHTMSSTSLHEEGLKVDSTVFSELGVSFVAGGWIIAGKTGYTDEAGLCLATAARFGGVTYVLVTAGAPGDRATSQADVDDARYVYGQIPGV